MGSPACVGSPACSTADQARLNTANREANRLNAQAYRLQQQGRDAEAATLREQAAVHRAEAARITDTLRSAGGGGGGSGSGGRLSSSASESGRPTYQELVEEVGRVGAGLEHLGIGDSRRSRQRQRASARLFEKMFDVQVRSVKKRTGVNQKTPDLVIDTWRSTLDLKNPDQPSLEAFKRALRKGRKQASHVFIDVRGLDLAERKAAAFVDRALGNYPVEWLCVVGDGWTVERW